MANDKIAALQQWCQEKTKEDLIAVVVTMTRRTKDAEQKAQELKIQLEQVDMPKKKVAKEMPEQDTVPYLMSEVERLQAELGHLDGGLRVLAGAELAVAHGSLRPRLTRHVPG